ncbi:MAG: carboxypeptidase-like regulatory domain-containing protein [Planctomycetaceae bacterium]|jgi:hypothetical protein|nr:carboxypeptidase-like regulatory domain-containing protein [Planctomycetaceae bacterium]
MQRFFVLFFVLLTLGCSGNVGLTGRVVFSDNEEPLPNGMVTFVQPTFQARGFISADGRYTVGSLKETDGLPPGTYQVCVFCTNADEIPLIDPKYAYANQSGLTVTVDASTKTFDIKVDRAAKR